MRDIKKLEPKKTVTSPQKPSRLIGQEIFSKPDMGSGLIATSPRTVDLEVHGLDEHVVLKEKYL